MYAARVSARANNNARRQMSIPPPLFVPSARPGLSLRPAADGSSLLLLLPAHSRRSPPVRFAVVQRGLRFDHEGRTREEKLSLWAIPRTYSWGVSDQPDAGQHRLNAAASSNLRQRRLDRSLFPRFLFTAPHPAARTVVPD